MRAPARYLCVFILRLSAGKCNNLISVVRKKQDIFGFFLANSYIQMV